MGEKRPVGLHTMAAGMEIPPCKHILGSENLQQCITAESCLRFIYFKDDVLIVAPFCFIMSKKPDTRNLTQLFPIGVIVAAVDGDEVTDAFKRCQSHCRRDLAHLTVRADVDHVVESRKTEVLHQPDLPRQLVVVGDDGAPFKGVEELRRMEAEYLGISEPSDHAPAVGTSERMGGIKE